MPTLEQRKSASRVPTLKLKFCLEVGIRDADFGTVEVGILYADFLFFFCLQVLLEVGRWIADFRTVEVGNPDADFLFIYAQYC